MTDAGARVAGGLLIVTGAIDLYGATLTVAPFGSLLVSLSAALLGAVASAVALVLLAVAMRCTGLPRWAAALLVAAAVLAVAVWTLGDAVGATPSLVLGLLIAYQVLVWLRALALLAAAIAVAAAPVKGAARWGLLAPAGIGVLLLAAQVGGLLADVAIIGPLGAVLALAWLAAGLVFLVAPPVRRPVPTMQEVFP